ncbi:MAG TPA: nuclear transport factor 2 family protein [Pyrinomonadaceae bacterium]|nr:nuclear transport factor 2 family protein [Pyrinomonadaceae bacterium]
MKNVLSVLLTLTVFCSLGFSQQKSSPSLDSLVAAENAFAATSVAKGIRESFLMFFAEDGINFQPHPTKTREAFLKRPAPATRPPVELNWRPVYADVSRAGDLGYTTGPYTFKDLSPEKAPTRYGYYFSIWKKQANGEWKVAVDCGISTPEPTQQLEFKPAPQIKWKVSRKINLESERASLIDLDRQFLKTSESPGIVESYLRYFGSEARLHRDGLLPMTERAAIRSYLSSQISKLSWTPIKSDVAQSVDLGYTYGSYELKFAGTNKTEKGYYVRVWKRDDRGNWKLVLDTFSPIPEES